MENKFANNFLRKELLRPREELNDNNLFSLGWKKGEDLDNDKTTLAECCFESKTISFSKNWFRNPSKELAKEIILHEIAHAIDDILNAPDKNKMPPHNRKWRAIAKKLGCKFGARVPVKKTIFGKTIIDTHYY